MIEFYTWLLLVIPDWLMGLLMLAAAVLCWRRIKQGNNRSVLALVLPLLGFSLFYWWGTLFDPEPLPWIAGGRAASFGLGLGICLWALLTRGDG